MQPVKTPDLSSLDKNQLLMVMAKHDRKVFAEALEKGSLACLPDKDGYADTESAKNVINGTQYKGTGMLLLKAHQKENHFPTAEYLLFEQVQAVNERLYPDTKYKVFIIPGSKGVTLNYQIDREPKSLRLFNIAQVTKPEIIRIYAKLKAAEREAMSKDQSLERKQAEKQTEIICSSTKAAEYLGQYFAAAFTNGRFKATRSQAAEFVKNAKEMLFEHGKSTERNPEGPINPFNLNRLSAQASSYCKEFINELNDRKKSPVLSPKREASVPEMGR